MASADLYSPSLLFLSGDAGDVFKCINDEQSGLMKSGSVVTSRAIRSKEARQGNARPLSVDIVPASVASRVVGPGWCERDLAFDLAVCVRLKDTPPGANQLALLDKVTRALVNRYDGVSDLVLAPSVPMGTTAAFRRSRAAITSVDEVSESSELARAVVRLVLTFTEPMVENA